MNENAFRIRDGRYKTPANIGNIDRGLLAAALISEYGNVYTKNNTTPTTVVNVNSRYIIAGEFNIADLSYNFIKNEVCNGLTYTGDEAIILANMSFSLRSSNNQRIGIYLAVDRDGNFIPTEDRISESEIYLITTGSTAQDLPQPGTIHALIHLHKGDTVYGIVQNTTSTANIIVEFANLIVTTI